MKTIGKVVHWYDKIEVAVLKLNGTLKVGDKIKVTKGDTEFEETVDSLQLDHENVKSGKKGQDVALKLSKEAKVGAEISLVK